MNREIAERSAWASALSAVPAAELLSLGDELIRNLEVRPKSIPQAGLGILKLNDSALREDFFLGEFPFASAWLEVTTPDGERAEGAAQLMDDRLEVVEAVALCDAVLSARLPGWERVLRLVDRGLALREATRRERKLMLAQTRVDFSLLDETGGDDVKA